MPKRIFIPTITLIFICFSQALIAQTDSLTEEIIKPVRLNGPRFGVTYVGPGELADQMKEELNVNPIITQFGWQFETRFFTLPSGTSGLVEGVLLIGGLEQSTALPSGTFMVGIRSRKGLEFGLGPNLSLAGAAFAFAAGINLRAHNVNFPINFAVVTSKDGIRYSLLIGFNARRR